jgi:hypothetical protein
MFLIYSINIFAQAGTGSDFDIRILSETKLCTQAHKRQKMFCNDNSKHADFLDLFFDDNAIFFSRGWFVKKEAAFELLSIEK